MAVGMCGDPSSRPRPASAVPTQPRGSSPVTQPRSGAGTLLSTHIPAHSPAPSLPSPSQRPGRFSKGVCCSAAPPQCASPPRQRLGGFTQLFWRPEATEVRPRICSRGSSVLCHLPASSWRGTGLSGVIPFSLFCYTSLFPCLGCFL